MPQTTTKRTAFIETRSQSAKGSFPRQGPDTYIAVQVVPEGVQPLQTLNQAAAARRGIEIIYCGEGYRTRQQSPQSMLRQALAHAQEIAAEVNEQQ